ncbi:MAG: porin, partial [Pseudomonadota bacterium]
MIKNRKLRTFLSCAVSASLVLPTFASASPAISGGVWFNYRNVADNDRDNETAGDIADEALVLYVDDKKDGRPWSFSAETRFGPGSFTDPDNNSTGDSYTIHKAWIGYQMSDSSQLKIGKSQVPFGWKTANFWPGDVLLGGYGDQMDVGIKYSGSDDALSYDLAYYHADDWGETSTDSVDDNGHWG